MLKAKSAGNVATMGFWQAMIRACVRRIPVSVVLGFAVLLLWPAESLAAALVRFIHAVPSAGVVTVKVTQSGSQRSAGAIGFGQVTPWRSIRPGQFEWALVADNKTLAHGTATVGAGAYDLVLLAKPNTGVSLGIFKAQAGRAGTALVRVIHAAPGLGAPQLRVDSKPAVSSLAFTQATPYLSVTPGVHTLSANPVHSTVPLISAKVTVAAGKAYSEIVLGSDGQRVRVVTVVDRSAPLTRVAARKTSDRATPATAVIVTVKPGDSLWKIARAHLGAAASPESVYRLVVAIWNLNAAGIGTGDPNLIFAGDRLTIPTT